MKKAKAKVEPTEKVTDPNAIDINSIATNPDANTTGEEKEKEIKDKFNLEYELSKTAYLPALLYGHLPDIIKKCVKPFSVPREKDVVLLSVLTVLSGTIPEATGLYDGCTVHANFNSFIIAPPASGKGVMAHAKKVGSSIHKQRVQAYDEKMLEYKSSRAKKDAEEEKGPRIELPKQTMFYIPGNSSAASVINHLNDNDGNGIICETEADTVSNVMKQDWGGYSDIIRKAFHHETVSISRKKDREFCEIDKPKISMLLTSTPSQITGLIKSANDGLFSRFLFYAFSAKPKWKKDIFDKNRGNLDEIFDDIADEVEAVSSWANMVRPTFTLTESQIKEFTTFFEGQLQQFCALTAGDSPSFVKRFGLIFYRIAMVLSVYRHYEASELSQELICTDEDFQTAKSIVSVCLLHNLVIYEYLIHTDEKAKNEKGSSLGVNKFFSLITASKEHSRAELIAIGEKNQFGGASIDKYLKVLTKEGLLTQPKFGVYFKK